MGKNKGKKDDEKKAALAARKEAKQEKSARKRLAKEQGSVLDDQQQQHDELDEVLQAYINQEKSGTAAAMSERENPVLEAMDTPFPLPRANATLCDVDGDKRDYFYLFGGEYFDGVSNIFVDELLRYEVSKKEWKKIMTAPRPNPRCAHSCISYKQNLYVFGGEVSVGDQFHHFRDLWKFDTRTMKWEEIIARNPPSARSGHAAFLWKNYMVIFGGFFEAAKDTKWYNDVAVFNLQTELWMDVPQSRLAEKPEPRSACNFSSFGNDKVLIHGGFSKMKSVNSSSETKVHSDAWVLHLAPILQQKPPTWERWMSSTKGFSSATPNGRAGTACVSHKSRMLVFGGVIDSEQQNHKVDSVFYNSLMALDIEKRKWFPVRVKAKAVSGGPRRRRRKGGKDDLAMKNDITIASDGQNDDDDDDSSSRDSDDLEEENEEGDNGETEKTGWDLDMLRANMFAFVDGDGNLVYERIDEEDDQEAKQIQDQDSDKAEEEKEEEKEEEEEKDEEKEGDEEVGVVVDKQDHAGNKTSENQSKPGRVVSGSRKLNPTVTSSSVMAVNPETNVPEVIERKDPLPRINASLLTIGQTLYLYGGVLEVGDREVTLDDMWCVDLRKRESWECLWPGTMHKQVWRGAVFDDDDSYISTGKEDGSDDDGDNDDLSDDEANMETKRDTVGISNSKKDSEAARSSSIPDRDDQNRTPMGNESLTDFYTRTSKYWNKLAADTLSTADAELSNKEIKREGFKLAQIRFDELQALTQGLKGMSLGSKERADDKRESKKNSKKSSKK